MPADLATVLPVLHAIGATHIVAAYGGGNDEGHVYTVALRTPQGTTVGLEHIPADLRDTLYALADDWISNYYGGGWGGGEGQLTGTMTYDIATGKVTCEQYWTYDDPYSDEYDPEL